MINLKEKHNTKQLSSSAINSHISSLNNILKYVEKQELHIKASDYNLSRKFNDSENKENTRESAQKFKEWLNKKYTETGRIGYKALQHAVNIQSVNLRLRESLAVKLLNKDLSNNILQITDKKGAGKWDGSKNTRPREIKLSEEQKMVLLEARDFLKQNRLTNLNTHKTLKAGKTWAQNILKKYRKETNNPYFHYHGERHWQAHQAYKESWQASGYNNIECRARLEISDKKEWMAQMIQQTGLSRAEFIKIEREIRYSISQSLGHERISITNRYLG